jgi:hypothetical protein
MKIHYFLIVLMAMTMIDICTASIAAKPCSIALVVFFITLILTHKSYEPWIEESIVALCLVCSSVLKYGRFGSEIPLLAVLFLLALRFKYLFSSMIVAASLLLSIYMVFLGLFEYGFLGWRFDVLYQLVAFCVNLLLIKLLMIKKNQGRQGNRW